ncbi:MAG: C-terminal binding protein [Burkholderiales bacterium]|nr:C-terminal binding protein [Burkholderiales bacterium]
MAPVSKKRVIAIDGGYDTYNQEIRILSEVGAQFELMPCGGDAGNIADKIRAAHALMVRESRIDAGMIASMPHLKAIVRYGIGVDNIDLAAAKQRCIAVANVPDYGTEEVSDQAVALLLAVARRVVTRDAAVRRGRWNVSREEPMYRIAGKTLGLLGYGRIARAVERKLRAFGVERVCVFDPFVSKSVQGVELMTADEVCRQADYLSINAPNTPQTHHLLNAHRLALMKPTAMVVNTARGALIDEAALVSALQQRRIFGAGLDVYEREPFSTDNPLCQLDNVVLSDHTGWYSEESVKELQLKAAQEVGRILSGKTPNHWCNPW